MNQLRQSTAFDIVRELGLRFPRTNEIRYYGMPALEIEGKVFVVQTRHRSADPNSISVAVGFECRDKLIADRPRLFYVKPHYQSYPVVLVRLDQIDRAGLDEVLRFAYAAVASSRVKMGRSPTARRSASLKMKVSIFLTSLVALSFVRMTAAVELEFDHVWIVVSRDASERAALERAGLKVSPDVNRNDGQGTASVSAEFQNAYIELMWPDPTVSVAPGAERGVEKFKNRMNWRTSGWSPLGIALRRTGGSAPLPFPTWSIAPDWMPKGTAIEILIAREDTKSPSFFIEPPVLAVKKEANRKGDSASPASDHPIGVERVTAIQIIRPKDYQPVAAFTYLEKAGIFKSSEGKEWAIEMTFDGGRKAQSKDLRPDLPLIIHY